MKTWPQEKIDDFRNWHTARLIELQYPPALVEELTNARERWLPAPETKDRD
jgi:hypothetical protein